MIGFKISCVRVESRLNGNCSVVLTPSCGGYYIIVRIEGCDIMPRKLLKSWHPRFLTFRRRHTTDLQVHQMKFKLPPQSTTQPQMRTMSGEQIPYQEANILLPRHREPVAQLIVIHFP